MHPFSDGGMTNNRFQDMLWRNEARAGARHFNFEGLRMEMQREVKGIEAATALALSLGGTQVDEYVAGASELGVVLRIGGGPSDGNYGYTFKTYEGAGTFSHQAVLPPLLFQYRADSVSVERGTPTTLAEFYGDLHR